jgi:methionyl-tRNA formyltransferase
VIALQQRGHALRWIHEPARLASGDVCLLLSCGRLLSAEQLAMHRYNLVIHESDLPRGQGWSPMTWQILEGASRIPISLFEAVADLDAGPIHLQTSINLNGTEVVDEWRQLQAEATINLCLQWVDRYLELIDAARPQHGEPSHYRRRRPADSRLDPERTLAEQFELLRVVDNDRYPAFFEWRGRRYCLDIRARPVSNRNELNEATAPPLQPPLGHWPSHY